MPKKSEPVKPKPKIKGVLGGGVVPQPGSKDTTRMALMLWGPSGVGKTTWAATAPGVKLWLSLGDQEHVSVQHREDVIVAQYSHMGFEDLFKHAQNDNPFGLDGFLADNEEIETVVLDSATALTYRALQKAVHDKVGAGRGFVPTMEAPGISAYGGRNGIVLEVLTGLLRITAKYNVHLIVTTHEADPKERKDAQQGDIIDYITCMLGGQVVNNVTYRLSEVWHLGQDTNKDGTRRVRIRNSQLRRPMKTRMFSNKGPSDFVLRYDPDLPDRGQMTISSLYNAWADNGFEKVPVPGSNK